MAEVVSVKTLAAISAVVTRADGTVEDLGVISVLEVEEQDEDEE